MQIQNQTFHLQGSRGGAWAGAADPVDLGGLLRAQRTLFGPASQDVWGHGLGSAAGSDASLKFQEAMLQGLLIGAVVRSFMAHVMQQFATQLGAGSLGLLPGRDLGGLGTFGQRASFNPASWVTPAGQLSHELGAPGMGADVGGASHGISERSIKMIAEMEGIDQPGKWPKASSGITIGHGYDLGYVSKAQFRRDWAGKLSPSDMSRLEGAIGKTGTAARDIAHRYSDIHIDRQAAKAVFRNRTIPSWIAKARATFPGFDRLSPDAKGALTSLVFNRGTKMTGERRREMRALKAAVARGDLGEASRQISAMKRLWAGRGLGGLLRRRDAEANMMLA